MPKQDTHFDKTYLRCSQKDIHSFRHTYIQTADNATNRQTVSQSNGQTDSKTNRQTVKRTNSQTDSETNRQTVKRTNKQTGRQWNGQTDSIPSNCFPGSISGSTSPGRSSSSPVAEDSSSETSIFFVSSLFGWPSKSDGTSYSTRYCASTRAEAPAPPLSNPKVYKYQST